LLGNNASGRMPQHLQLESGFPEQETVSSIGDEIGTAKKKRNVVVDLRNELSMVKKQRAKVDEAIDKVMLYLDSKSSAEDKKSMDSCIRRITDYSSMMSGSTVLNTMSPDSRNLYVNGLKLERKQLLTEMTRDTNVNDNNDKDNSD